MSKTITCLKERAKPQMLIKFDTWDISRLELSLNLQAAQHYICSSRGQVLRAIRNEVHCIPPITRITNERYLPYAVQLISTKMCPEILRQHLHRLPYFTSRVFSYTLSFLIILSSSFKLGIKINKPDKPLATYTAKTREVSAAVQMRSSLFWHVTQRRLVVTDVRDNLSAPSSTAKQSDQQVVPKRR